MEDFKKAKIEVIGMIFFLITQGLSLPDLTTLKGKVVSGVYWEESTQQLQLYEKVVPLVFEFRIRSDLWSTLPAGYNKFKVLPRLNCRSDNKSSSATTMSDWFFTCPIFYHVNDFLKQYKNNYTDLHPTMRTISRQISLQESQRFSHSDINFDDCDQIISRAWKGVNGRDVGLVEYRGLIEKCNSLPSYFEEQIPDYNYDVGTIFDHMKENFASYFFLNASNSDPGEMINNLLGVQSLHLLNTYSEITRFREAVLSCQNQIIPYSFVKATRLDKALQEIRLKLLPLKYILSIPSIAKLYKVPIADCIFGTTNLIIQILVPVIRQSNNFNLLKLHYPQFLYKDQLCQVKPSSEGTSTDVEYFLYDRGSKALVHTNCKPNDRDLCHIPDQSQRPLLNKCIYEVLNASFEGIRNYCTFQCKKQSPAYQKLILPIILRVSPSKFVITVDRITTMLIKCEGKPDELITPQQYGAVEITLPCSCHIMYHSEQFYSRTPCGNSLFVKHVIPEHMVNSSLAKESKFFIFEPSDKVNFSLLEETDVDLIDLGSPSDIPVNLDLNGSTTVSNGTDGHLFIFHGNGANNHTDTNACISHHVYIWTFVAFQTTLFFISLVLIYVKIVTISKKWEYGRSAVCFSVSQMTNLDDNK